MCVLYKSVKFDVCSVFLQELRDVLHEHSWIIEDALEALRMFSEHGEDFLLLSFSWNEKRCTL